MTGSDGVQTTGQGMRRRRETGRKLHMEQLFYGSRENDNRTSPPEVHRASKSALDSLIPRRLTAAMRFHSVQDKTWRDHAGTACSVRRLDISSNPQQPLKEVRSSANLEHRHADQQCRHLLCTS